MHRERMHLRIGCRTLGVQNGDAPACSCAGGRTKNTGRRCSFAAAGDYWISKGVADSRPRRTYVFTNGLNAALPEHAYTLRGVDWVAAVRPWFAGGQSLSQEE